jgi:hypothetical protein
MGIALDRHVGRYLDGAIGRHASHVVAPQIDEHDVLRTLLLTLPQLLGEKLVLLYRAAPWARPRNGMRLYRPALDPDQHLWRRTHDRPTAHPEKVHVGRRVHVSQRAVCRERIGIKAGLKSL